MSLPELDWQIVYGKLAWTVVLAAVLLSLWQISRQTSRRTIIVTLAGIGILQAWPNEVSPAYWLGLAFQAPSGLFVGLCLAKLHSVWHGNSGEVAISRGLAMCLGLGGAILYLDAIGLLSQGFYYQGFSPYGTPLLTAIVAIACSILAVRGQAQGQALALLLAMVIFSVFRLPTGNIWDAFIDPMLWAWAVVSLGRHYLWRRVHNGKSCVATQGLKQTTDAKA